MGLPVVVSVDSNLLKEMMNLNNISDEVKDLLSKNLK